MTEKEINEIADNIIAGLTSYIDRDSNEIIAIPDIDEFSDTYEVWADQIKEIKENYDRYIIIEKMDSGDSFKVMERFIEYVSNGALREKLLTALAKRKPFSNFKFEIDNSGPFRQKWFDFQKEQVVKWVKDQLELDNLQ